MNLTKTANGNASASVEQHQTPMQPLYPDKQGYKPAQPCMVGAVILASEPITYNQNRTVHKITVHNTGDRPVQVGSHFHFFEVNRYLEFDRDAAFGMHLNIPATTAIRFEPGDSREVEVVAYGGKRRVIGFNNLVKGYTGIEDAPVYYPSRLKALRRLGHSGFKSTDAISLQHKNCKNESEK